MMQEWKPLEPTPRHGQTTKQSPAATTAYAAPAKATRSAPAARPHPPSLAPGYKRRSLLPSWLGGQGSAQYASAPGTENGLANGSSNQASNTLATNPGYIGPLPSAIHRCIIEHLSVADLARYAIVCHSLSRLVCQDDVWATRVRAINWRPVLDTGDELQSTEVAAYDAAQAQDDFGDFTEANGIPVSGERPIHAAADDDDSLDRFHSDN